MSGEVFNIDSILFDLFDNGGGSYSVLVSEDRPDAFVRSDIPDGYMVSVGGFGRIIDRGVTTSNVGTWQDQLDDFVHSVYMPYYAQATLDIKRIPFLGIWWDKGSEQWYLDVSLYVYNREEALSLGAQWGELAIWDNAKAEEIRL